jgi:flagellar biosynthesis protein FlhF
MKIKRYTAASMRIALAQVRAEQGPDAVILSSRRMEDGIEVIAAVDYDETLIFEAGRRRESPAAAREAAVPPAAAHGPPPAIVNTAAPSRTALKARPAPAPQGGSPPGRDAPAQADAGYIAMQRELRDLRHLMENELASITWKDKRSRDPLRVRVLEELAALDIAPDVALSLVKLMPRNLPLERLANIPAALLAKNLPVIGSGGTLNARVVAVVGPTGAGKTTSIAKLAARWSMKHGSDDLAIVSTDGYRIGAREQLLTYARILGAPMHAANSGKELAQVLKRLSSKKLVLIDTAGIGLRDARSTEQLNALQLGAAGARILLALPAQGEAQALDAITAAFAPLSPFACILTKIDEAASLGAAMSTVMRHKLPIAYLCNGQRVPEDLHSAQRRCVWLVKAAVKLKQHAPTRRDESYLARNFGRVQTHA